MASLRNEIEHFSCFTRNPVVEVGDVGKDGVGVVARAQSQACVDHPQKFKKLVDQLDKSEGSHCLQHRDWSSPRCLHRTGSHLSDLQTSRWQHCPPELSPC